MKARRARCRSRVHSELLKCASAETMLKKTGGDHPHTNALQSISREALLAARPRRTHNDGVDGFHPGPEDVRTVTLVLYLGGEQCGCGEQMTAGLFDAFPTFSRMGARRSPRTFSGLGSWATSHAQPAMLGGHLLATRGARSCAGGSVRASRLISLFEALDPAGSKTLRSGETCERRLPFLGTAAVSPKKKPGSAKTQRYDEGCLVDSPYLNGLDCFWQCPVCTTTDQSGISRTHRWPMQYSKLLQKLGWEQ